MTTSDVDARVIEDIGSIGHPIRRLAALAVLVAVADTLFFKHEPGVSLTLFLLAVCAASSAVNVEKLETGRLVLASAVRALALAPSVESLGWLSTLFAVGGAALFARLTAGSVTGGLGREAVATLCVALAGPIQLIIDATWVRTAMSRSRITRARLERLLAWCAPAALGLVFLILFRTANPIIDDLLAQVDVTRFLAELSPARIGLWLAIAAVCWSFVFVGRFEPRLLPQTTGQATPTTHRENGGPIFGTASILRSLAVFNALFAVQSLMDLAYLWGRAALPEDLTYAAYAHRGAYALLAAALLSAGVMLTAMRSGRAVEQSPLIRTLAYLWMAQNVLLVVSSMRRLGLYVEAYTLTYLRVAALIWMALVAVGLVLIIWQIARRKSAAWLISSNAVALALTLYACSFVNFADVIARYNVAHSAEMGGDGPALDVSYLCSLGPHALPAIDDAASQRFGGWPSAVVCAHNLRAAHDARPRDWRSWTLRDWRLSRYLRNNPGPAT